MPPLSPGRCGLYKACKTTPARSPLGRAGGRAARQAFPAPGSRASPSEAPGRGGRSGRIPHTPPRRDGARLHRGSPACTGWAALLIAGKSHPYRGAPRDPSPSHTAAPLQGLGTPALPHTGPTLTTRFPLKRDPSPPPITPPSPRQRTEPPGTARLPGLTRGQRGPAKRAGAEQCGRTRDSNPGTAPARPGPTRYRIGGRRSQRAFRPIPVRASAWRGGHGGAP